MISGISPIPLSVSCFMAGSSIPCGANRSVSTAARVSHILAHIAARPRPLCRRHQNDIGPIHVSSPFETIAKNGQNKHGCSAVDTCMLEPAESDLVQLFCETSSPLWQTALLPTRMREPSGHLHVYRCPPRELSGTGGRCFHEVRSLVFAFPSFRVSFICWAHVPCSFATASSPLP